LGSEILKCGQTIAMDGHQSGCLKDVPHSDCWHVEQKQTLDCTVANVPLC